MFEAKSEVRFVIAKLVSTALQQTLLTDHRSSFETGRLMGSRAKHDIYGLANYELQTSDRSTSSKVRTRFKYLHSHGDVEGRREAHPITRPKTSSPAFGAGRLMWLGSSPSHRAGQEPFKSNSVSRDKGKIDPYRSYKM
jgi:hypothetical protein